MSCKRMFTSSASGVVLLWSCMPLSLHMAHAQHIPEIRYSDMHGVSSFAVSTEPETCYAIADGSHIAYQVVGRPTPQLLMVPGMFSHLEMQWRLPSYRRFMRALARHCCLIRFDKRGTGLSDP